MKWTVVWNEEAQDDLATIWTNGPDRNAVTAASARIDQLLKSDPLNVGESRIDDERILIVPPLAVTYTVSPDDMLVTVRSVWRTN